MKYSLQRLRGDSFCPKTRVPQTGCFPQSWGVRQAAGSEWSDRCVVYFDKVTDCICARKATGRWSVHNPERAGPAPAEQGKLCVTPACHRWVTNSSSLITSVAGIHRYCDQKCSKKQLVPRARQFTPGKCSSVALLRSAPLKNSLLCCKVIPNLPEIFETIKHIHVMLMSINV